MAVYTAIDDAGSNFNTVLYTATGSSLGVTGAGFQPDLTWIKNRDAADFWVVTDAVRGATKYIKTDTSTAETTNVESLKSFDSDGFTVGTQVEVNTNTEKYASWNWKAGTTTGIAGSPSITPTAYSLNATAGQSIITYTGNGVAGATVPHGLGVAPDMIITKRLDDTSNWLLYTSGSASDYGGNTYAGFMDTAARFSTDTTFWNDTSATSTLFSLGTYDGVNADTGTYVAYCYANIQGYSKFSRYIGTASTNGPFVYTGFRPAWIVTKKASNTGSWFLLDNKRNTYNPADLEIAPDLVDGEGGIDTINVDFLSNGFKIRATATAINDSGAIFFYMAFADAPFVNSSGVPVNAR